MALPSRFETYKGFVITADSVEIGGKWTVGGYIRTQADASSEEMFRDKRSFAKSHEEALELSIAFGKQLIDSRESTAP